MFMRYNLYIFYSSKFQESKGCDTNFHAAPYFTLSLTLLFNFRFCAFAFAFVLHLGKQPKLTRRVVIQPQQGFTTGHRCRLPKNLPVPGPLQCRLHLCFAELVVHP